MLLRRLSWAGVEATEGDWRILIDPLENTLPFRSFARAATGAARPIDEGTWAVVTHVHPDHCDRSLLARVPSGHVVCHAPIAAALAQGGVRPVAANLWQKREIGPFLLSPVPSQDWRGDDQLGWVIEIGDRRFIHCGDTIWHGQWYEIARRFGPFDVAFLPINGFLARLEGFTPNGDPGISHPRAGDRGRRHSSRPHGLRDPSWPV